MTHLVEGLDPGPGHQARSGLVEGDVAVGPDAADEEPDAAGFGDLPLVLLALGLKVGRVAVEDVHVGGVDVDVLRKKSIFQQLSLVSALTPNNLRTAGLHEKDVVST